MTGSQNTELAAKRWAKALMELAQENEGISKETILSNLIDVADNISSSEELQNAVNNPSISVEEKQIVLCKLFEGRVIPLVYNFLFALNLKKRLGIISDIIIEFQKELERIKNIVRVNVTSAIELNDEKKNDIKNKISEKLHKEVILNYEINSDIIGGLVFNINDTIVDNSIKHKLDNLQKEIIKA